MPNRLLLIDGHAIVYRAFFAMPALTNTRGEMTNAAYGFTSMLIKVLTEERPTHAIAAFDPKGPTFRHEEDATYKAQRPSMPDDLRPQFPWCRDICSAFGIPIVEVPGFEADDVIGTLSLQAEAAGVATIILTGDLDALQLVSPSTIVYAPKRGITETVIYDVAGVEARFGFGPSNVIDYKALRGDTSDNIPGIPGVGEKTAAALVIEHGDLDGVIAAIPTMKAGKLRDNLEAHADQARHSRHMATIRRDVEITLDLDAAELRAYDMAVVTDVFERLEFRSLLSRLPQFDETVPELPPVAAGVATETEIIHDAGEASVALERLTDNGAVALRSIAEDGEIIGVALATLDGDRAIYLDLSPSLDAAQPDAVASVAAVIADPAIAKYAYDIKREMLLWGRRGVHLDGIGFDALLAAYLVNTRTRVAPLAVLAKDLCGIDIDDDDALIGSGRTRRRLADIPADELGQHLGSAAGSLGPVSAALRTQLDAAGVTELYETMELPLASVLASMESTGIRVDPALLRSLSGELQARINEIEAEVAAFAGHPFNIGSTQQLAAFLYDEIGLAVGRKTKTGRSTDADTLEALREEHAAVALVLEWRQLTKLRGTYVETLPLICDSRGRVHTSFNQAVAATGRLSSADPNLQNIPVRTAWGQRIRATFVAEPGRLLVSADYSQIELRVLAHLTGEDNLIDAFARGEDIHTRTAAEVYGVDSAAVTKDMRRIAKVVNFGVLYGLSDFGLARDTGMARDQAAAFIERYFASFPKVTAYLETIRNHAREYGWVETEMGRRRYLPDIRAANRQLRNAAERMAVNMPMQGTAADIMKIAMLRAHKNLHEASADAQLVLQVHDELVVDTEASAVDDVADLLRDAMSGAAALKVPLDVDVKIGQNWAAMTPGAAPAGR